VVEIAPEFGNLTRINAVYPHWLGNIEMNLVPIGTGVKGQITIPEGMNAVFKWKNSQLTLKAGKQEIQFL
jgi:hypothetical protein